MLFKCCWKAKIKKEKVKLLLFWIVTPFFCGRQTVSWPMKNLHLYKSRRYRSGFCTIFAFFSLLWLLYVHNKNKCFPLYPPTMIIEIVQQGGIAMFRERQRQHKRPEKLWGDKILCNQKVSHREFVSSCYAISLCEHASSNIQENIVTLSDIKTCKFMGKFLHHQIIYDGKFKFQNSLWIINKPKKNYWNEKAKSKCNLTIRFDSMLVLLCSNEY